MTLCKRADQSRGFALVLTVVLLALLVSAIYGLSLLVRVNGEVAAAAAHQFQARQNALLGLAQAKGALQRLAGPDDRVTAMAGIAGEPGGSQRRHWCGVWDGAGVFLGWLTSGAEASGTASLVTADVVALVERRSVGTKPSTLSAYADEEYVDAGKIPIVASRGGSADTITGRYAYWVGDEGVKISARVAAAQLPPGGVAIRAPGAPLNIARMGAAFQQFDAANAAKVLSYEQGVLLSFAAGNRLTVANLQDAFHHVTLTHMSVSPDGGALVAGKVNLNTTSPVVWRSLIESYEAAPGATPFGSAAKRTSAINALANGISASAAGKFARGPYRDVASFLTSTLLQSAITGTNGVTVAQFAAAMEPMLTVRSDTFRVRAYGESVNAADPARVEAIACCEAIVQRTLEGAPDGAGRRFVVTYFRWLGPDDR